jgi:hypothetical protein
MDRSRYRPCGPALLVALALTLTAPVGPSVAHGADPSPEYQASLRRTLELRKQRRSARAVAPRPAPVGVIVPYPMPPALIIRQTREKHDEIEALLDLLRRS